MHWSRFIVHNVSVSILTKCQHGCRWHTSRHPGPTQVTRSPEAREYRAFLNRKHLQPNSSLSNRSLLTSPHSLCKTSHESSHIHGHHNKPGHYSANATTNSTVRCHQYEQPKVGTTDATHNSALVVNTASTRKYAARRLDLRRVARDTSGCLGCMHAYM